MPSTTSTFHGIPHDSLFRAALSDMDVARDFLTHHLPSNLRAGLRLDTLTLCPTESVQHFKRLAVDMLYEVERTYQGRKALVYVCVEHQRKQERLMPLRMLRYTVRILYAYAKSHPQTPLPLVIPLVVYNGTRPYKAPCTLTALCDATEAEIAQMLGSYAVIDLCSLEDSALVQEHLFGVLGRVMKHAGKRGMLEVMRSILPTLAPLMQRADDGRREWLDALLDYALLHTTVDEYEACYDTVSTYCAASEEEEEDAMAKRKNIYEIGIEQGIEQGIARGRQEGIKTMVLRLLAQGFSAEEVASLTGIALDNVIQWRKEASL
jgi:predicted transposase/invertase (TIGR01784 family)